MKKDFMLMYLARDLIREGIVADFDEFIEKFSSADPFEHFEEHELQMILFDVSIKKPELDLVAKNLME